ncbi:MAG: DEAD/DEAH box helicase [Spirochaetales bacterium]|nr:DEAD/DEAH box helicase [Spirochaetales bacterium]
MDFNSFGLKPEILTAIEEWGFETPTEIQEKVIPFMLAEKKDLVGLAQTGTGKTAAFGLPLVNFADTSKKAPKALILSPTRELCLQISADLKQFAKHIHGLNVTPVYGGANIVTQIQELRRGSQIVVATPGRLVDLIKRGKINISEIERVVLDEADIMLNMGFKEELDAILENTPEDKNVLLLSATMPSDVARIASEYMTEPERFTVGKKNAGSENIEHKYYMVHSRDKYPALKRLLDIHPSIYGIVFCRTKISTQEIADKLIKDGYSAEAIHSDLSQYQRDGVMSKFRVKGFQILVATDVAARGIDVNDLTHIIHYDLPDEKANYVHRSGRTGRAGRKGMSLAIINMKEGHKIRMIERTLGQKITEGQVPKGSDICERQLMHLIDRVHSVNVDESQIAPYLSIIEEKLASLDREELLKHFVSLEFNQFLTYYKNTPDLSPIRKGERDGRGRSNAEGRGRNERGQYGKRNEGGRRGGGSGRYKTFQINLGRKDNVLPPEIINIVNKEFRDEKIQLGKIDIDRSWSLFEIESDRADEVANKLNSASFQGKKISVQEDARQPNTYRRGGSDGGRQGGRPAGKYGGRSSGKKYGGNSSRKRD